MKKNNERIHINENFIESNTSIFIELYDISLVRFMMHYKSIHYDDFHHNIEPQQIVEIEKEFIKTTLDFLKHRRRQYLDRQEKIFSQFLKDNKLTKDEFSENMESLDEKYDEYESENIPKYEVTEFISFTMKTNYLLVKANKIGCLIDLKKDFKFDEQVNTTEPDTYFDAKGSEKLVYLKELGIIDFLKKQNPDVSQNKLAKLLCILTGERHLQPGLNSMESNAQIMDRKNPYYSPKTAPKVREQLTQWGFKIMTADIK